MRQEHLRFVQSDPEFQRREWGEVDVACLTIPHSLDGFVQLDAARRKLGLAPEECMLGLETAHNLIIECLWSQAYQQVYVIPPSVVKSNRGHFRQRGARDDQSDEYLQRISCAQTGDACSPGIPTACSLARCGSNSAGSII